MFRGVRQCGFIPVLQSFGASPLKLWNSKILDDRNVHRRFHMSNFEKINRIHHFSTSLPLCLNAGWNEIYFDLDDLTRKAYKTNYVETTKIQIHANCRIRVIYFCDKIYDDMDIPQKFKMFLPNNHVCCKKRMRGDIRKESTTTISNTELEIQNQILEKSKKKKEEQDIEEDSKFEKVQSTAVQRFAPEIQSIKFEGSTSNMLLENDEESRLSTENVEDLKQKV